MSASGYLLVGFGSSSSSVVADEEKDDLAGSPFILLHSAAEADRRAPSPSFRVGGVSPVGWPSCNYADSLSDNLQQEDLLSSLVDSDSQRADCILQGSGLWSALQDFNNTAPPSLQDVSDFGGSAPTSEAADGDDPTAFQTGAVHSRSRSRSRTRSKDYSVEDGTVACSGGDAENYSSGNVVDDDGDDDGGALGLLGRLDEATFRSIPPALVQLLQQLEEERDELAGRLLESDAELSALRASYQQLSQSHTSSQNWLNQLLAQQLEAHEHRQCLRGRRSSRSCAAAVAVPSSSPPNPAAVAAGAALGGAGVPGDALAGKSEEELAKEQDMTGELETVELDFDGEEGWEGEEDVGLLANEMILQGGKETLEGALTAAGNADGGGDAVLSVRNDQEQQQQQELLPMGPFDDIAAEEVGGRNTGICSNVDTASPSLSSKPPDGQITSAPATEDIADAPPSTTMTTTTTAAAPAEVEMVAPANPTAPCVSGLTGRSMSTVTPADKEREEETDGDPRLSIGTLRRRKQQPQLQEQEQQQRQLPKRVHQPEDRRPPATVTWTRQPGAAGAGVPGLPISLPLVVLSLALLAVVLLLTAGGVMVHRLMVLSMSCTSGGVRGSGTSRVPNPPPIDPHEAAEAAAGVPGAPRGFGAVEIIPAAYQGNLNSGGDGVREIPAAVAVVEATAGDDIFRSGAAYHSGDTVDPSVTGLNAVCFPVEDPEPGLSPNVTGVRKGRRPLGPAGEQQGRSEVTRADVEDASANGDGVLFITVAAASTFSVVNGDNGELRAEVAAVAASVVKGTSAAAAAWERQNVAATTVTFPDASAAPPALVISLPPSLPSSPPPSPPAPATGAMGVRTTQVHQPGCTALHQLSNAFCYDGSIGNLESESDLGSGSIPGHRTNRGGCESRKTCKGKRRGGNAGGGSGGNGSPDAVCQALAAARGAAPSVMQPRSSGLRLTMADLEERWHRLVQEVKNQAKPLPSASGQRRNEWLHGHRRDRNVGEEKDLDKAQQQAEASASQVVAAWVSSHWLPYLQPLLGAVTGDQELPEIVRAAHRVVILALRWCSEAGYDLSHNLTTPLQQRLDAALADVAAMTAVHVDPSYTDGAAAAEAALAKARRCLSWQLDRFQDVAECRQKCSPRARLLAALSLGLQTTFLERKLDELDLYVDLDWDLDLDGTFGPLRHASSVGMDWLSSVAAVVYKDATWESVLQAARDSAAAAAAVGRYVPIRNIFNNVANLHKHHADLARAGQQMGNEVRKVAAAAAEMAAEVARKSATWATSATRSAPLQNLIAALRRSYEEQRSGIGCNCRSIYKAAVAAAGASGKAAAYPANSTEVEASCASGFEALMKGLQLAVDGAATNDASDKSGDPWVGERSREARHDRDCQRHSRKGGRSGSNCDVNMSDRTRRTVTAASASASSGRGGFSRRRHVEDQVLDAVPGALRRFHKSLEELRSTVSVMQMECRGLSEAVRSYRQQLQQH
ncbi:hypothetical protein VaNZ11_012194 [Volvox africanus]|uniref:Uncharacterized protein n=1 Tax=Volvox africanus TaxID=51714 RepID=A0ABQ5SDH4_9CHLO|nr:hypothetical protein VaNZ11_012194 [Volvox africanus]